jgi:hypothetical protein
MAPPTTSASADVEQALDHADLVGDLGAAEHDHEGRSGASSSRRARELALHEPPGADGSSRATPSVLACARCAAPNASLT